MQQAVSPSRSTFVARDERRRAPGLAKHIRRMRTGCKCRDDVSVPMLFRGAKPALSQAEGNLLFAAWRPFGRTGLSSRKDTGTV